MTDNTLRIIFSPCPNTKRTIARTINMKLPKSGPASSFTVAEMAEPARPTAQRRIYETISENTLTTPSSTDTISTRLARTDFAYAALVIGEHEVQREPIPTREMAIVPTGTPFTTRPKGNTAEFTTRLSTT